MASVGIRVLKQQLSAYLRRVQAGEAMEITDRGRVVAEILPAGWRGEAGLGPEALALVRAGMLRPARRPLPSSALRPVLREPAGTARRLLDELRGER